MEAFFPSRRPEAAAPKEATPAANDNAGLHAVAERGGWRVGWHDGEKFLGGYGPNVELYIDYWSLRAKSLELWHRNHYAQGFIGRILANKINTGLDLEAVPVEHVIGVAQDSLDEWTDVTELQWDLWANAPELCDYYGRQTFGEIQAQAELEAMVAGDVLWVVRASQFDGGPPRIQLVNGACIQTPMEKFGDPNILHGVELDSERRHVAYWIRKSDGTSERLPAVSKSGRRVAWLYYATNKRLDEVRGQPLLANALQSLKEIDRYRDATLRKAVIASMIALFVTKKDDVLGSSPLTGGATRRTAVTETASNGAEKNYAAAEFLPGTTLDRLATGEDIKTFGGQGTDEKFGDFERAIIASISWSKGFPPEIILLAFNSNYSASQAAIGELRNSLEPEREHFAAQNCQPVYSDWLIGEVLAGRLNAPGFLESWMGRTAADRYRFAAWTRAMWSGPVKPLIDPVKAANGAGLLLDRGLTTHTRSSRELTGTKFARNIRMQAKERRLAASLGVPLGTIPPDPSQTADDDDEQPKDKRAA